MILLAKKIWSRIPAGWRVNDRVFGWMLLKVIQHRPQFLSRTISEKATELALHLVMDILNKKGIRHCARCPSVEQLRAAGEPKQFYCPTHYDQAVKEISDASQTVSPPPAPSPV